jgi:hypothetical protein
MHWGQECMEPYFHAPHIFMEWCISTGTTFYFQ